MFSRMTTFPRRMVRPETPRMGSSFNEVNNPGKETADEEANHN
jgi:hypothetical protein